MRIIFSRKGFDSSAGGVPSPILPSGALAFLPIPEPGDNPRRGRPYRSIQGGGSSLGSLVADLTGEKLGPASLAHLDPDLDDGSVPRRPGWKPILGQTGAAEGHLRNQGVGEGDLFLFFGWFREVEEEAGRYRYINHSPDRHVLFGWLQVGRRIALAGQPSLPFWAQTHPHAVAPYGNRDSLYVAADKLRLGDLPCGVPGAGHFPRYSPALCLTAPGSSRSVWELPAWLHPHGRESCLSYHGLPDRWSRVDGHTRLQSVGRGQEFVLNCDHYPEAVAWARELIQTSVRS